MSKGCASSLLRFRGDQRRRHWKFNKNWYQNQFSLTHLQPWNPGIQNGRRRIKIAPCTPRKGCIHWGRWVPYNRALWNPPGPKGSNGNKRICVTGCSALQLGFFFEKLRSHRTQMAATGFSKPCWTVPYRANTFECLKIGTNSPRSFIYRPARHR